MDFNLSCNETIITLWYICQRICTIA